MMNRGMNTGYKLIYQSYCRENFLKDYPHVLSLKLSGRDLECITKFPNESELSKVVIDAFEADGLLVKDSGKLYSSIPHLNTNASKKIAEIATTRVDAIANNVTELIGEKVDKDFRHILLGTLTLGYLWQSVLNRVQRIKASGSMVIISDVENNPTLYVDGLGNGAGTYISWIQTTLQKNNKYLDSVFNHRDVIEMLISIYENGDMTPIGEAADRLRLLKVTKLVSQKYTHISANHLVDPQVTTKLIRDIKPLLTQLTKIGVRAVKEITAVADEAYSKIYSDKPYINKDFLVQAVYYVVSHSLMYRWGEDKVLPKWRSVPFV